MPILRRLRGAARRAWFLAHRARFRDTAEPRRRRVYVDVSVIIRHDANTGIQRVVRAMWSELRTLQQDQFDLVPVFAGPTHGYCYANQDFLNWRPSAPRTPVGMKGGDIFLGLDLAAQYLPNCVDQLEMWRSAGARVHIVVYDLLPLKHPEWFTPATVLHFQRWIEVVRHHADQALCISDEVARDLRARFGAGSGPVIGRLHLSGDILRSKPTQGSSEAGRAVIASMAKRPTVLMLGTLEPRKGHAAVLDAFDHLWATDPDHAPDLLVVGKAGWKTDGMQHRLREHPHRNRRLFWLDDVSDEELVECIDACTGLVFASYGEGFGLPLTEAALHGRWALARDLPVFREQGLSNVLYFDDDAPVSLGKEILALLDKAKGGPPEMVEVRPWSKCLELLLIELDEASPNTDRRDDGLDVAA